MNTDISPDPAPETNKAGKKNKSFWLDTLQTVVFAVLIFLAINTVTLRVRVYNISMRPTLEPGYFVLVNRLAYKWAEPGHGDVIVFHHQGNPKEDYVKRVIGLPGDTVDITDGNVFVNGTRLNEPYIMEPAFYNEAYLVPPNSFFVLGDNRNDSSDSHSWGYVKEEWVVGKALLIYWPFNQVKLLSIPDLVSAQQP